jgi:hypothetical protein
MGAKRNGDVSARRNKAMGDAGCRWVSYAQLDGVVVRKAGDSSTVFGGDGGLAGGGQKERSSVRHSGEGALCKIEGCLLSHSRLRGASDFSFNPPASLVRCATRSGSARVGACDGLSPLDQEGKVETVCWNSLLAWFMGFASDQANERHDFHSTKQGYLDIASC